MSRNGAKKTFTVEDLAAQTAGVGCRKDAPAIPRLRFCAAAQEGIPVRGEDG